MFGIVVDLAAKGKAGAVRKAFDFVAGFVSVAEAKRPTGESRQKVNQEYQRWFQAEIARPDATITGGAPDEINIALEKLARKEQAATRAYYQSVDSILKAEGEQYLGTVTTSYEQLVTDMETFGRFEAERARLAAACGVVPPPRLVDPELGHAFRLWRDRVQRATNPPKARPPLTPSANPLRIDLD